MRTEKEIKEAIALIESGDDPDNDLYLDEGDQSALSTLYWMLGDGNL